MNDRMRESLSALMDDQANELELERVLSQLATNEELRQTWTRYNLAQQTLHSFHCAHVEWDISSRVQAAIAGSQTAVMTGTHSPTRNRFIRPLVSFGVAASVALTVVVGGRQFMQADSDDIRVVDNAVTSSAPISVVGTMPRQANFGNESPVILQSAYSNPYQDLARERQRRYMQVHAEQAALNSPQGLVPFARVPEIHE